MPFLTSFYTNKQFFLQMVGWEINVPFQHKNRIFLRQGIGGDLVPPG